MGLTNFEILVQLGQRAIAHELSDTASLYQANQVIDTTMLSGLKFFDWLHDMTIPCIDRSEVWLF